MKTIANLSTLALAVGLLTLTPAVLHSAEGSEASGVKPNQESPQPASGEIVKISMDSIEIKDHQGSKFTFAITPDTKFGTKEHPAKREEFKDGEYVLVSYTKNTEGKMVAHIIRELPPHRQSKGE